MRRIARIALRVVVGLVVFVALLVAFLHTPWGKSFVRGRIEAKLAQAVRGHVTLGSVDYGFLFSHVELEDLTIRDRDDHPALAIASIHVALDRGSLLHGAPVIDELAVDGLVANIVQTGDGKTNLAGLFQPSGSPPPASIRVAKLHLAGSASIMRSDGTTLTVSDLAIEGDASARPAQQIVDAALTSITAKVTIVRPGSPPKQLDLAIHSIAVAQHGGTVEATIDELAFGALSIGSIHAQLGLVENKLEGVQAITITNGRIARDKLTTMLGKQVLVDDVTFDASLIGPATKLVAHGSVATRHTSLTLDGTVDLSEPARPGYDVVLVGKGDSEDVVSRGPPIDTELRVGIVGAGIVPPDVDAKITLDVGPTRVGAIAIDSVAMLAFAHRGGITLDHLTAHGLGFELAASGDIASDTTLHGKLVVGGNPPEAISVLRAAGIAVWHRVPPIPRLDVIVTASGKLDGELVLEVEPMHLAVAGGRVEMAAKATLDHRKVRTATTTITLSHLDLGGLARLAHAPAPKVGGSLSGTIALSRTADAQRATYDLAVALLEPAVIAQIHGAADGSAAELRAVIVRRADHAQLATLTARVAHDDLGLLPQRGWHVVVDAPARSLAELAALAPPELVATLQVPDGDLALHAELAGTPAQPRGTIDATLHAATPAGPQTVVLHSAITPTAHGVIVTTHGQGGLATVDSRATVPSLFAGRELAIATLKRSITADATIEIPDHELATLPMVSPAIARLGGSVGGRIEVTGAPAKAHITAALRWHGYALAGGGVGDTKLDLDGTPAHVVATLSHGPITIAADVTHTEEHLAVVAHVHTDPTPLVPLLPAAIVPDLHGADPGQLAWNMTAHVELAQHGMQFTLEDARVDGVLAVRGGSFHLPHGDRTWHDLELELAGDPAGIRLTKLAAHESDEQVNDRALEVSGLVTIGKLVHDDGTITLAPKKGELAISLRDWLVLGSGSPLLSDAPVATVNLGAKVTADLTAPILAIDATVEKLDVAVPDRLERSHQPEKWAVSNDVIFVDATHAPGALPVPHPMVEAHHPFPLDVRIHIPNPVHIQKSPLDLNARGELTVQVRETGVATRGTLEAVSGKLVLFGRDQPVVDGTLAFTDAHPHGEFALRFARPLPNEVVRELSRSDEPARVTLTGPPAKPNVALGGATNIELDEVLAIYHAGHPVFLTFPGLYPSATTEVPHGEQFLIFGFLANALPHLLFLDRVAAWADPSEPRGAYGRIRNLEAARYAADRNSRVRVVGRPTVPGRSTAEVQLDHLWVDSGRALFGAGLRAGDRIGGGLALFFEWSSAR